MGGGLAKSLATAARSHAAAQEGRVLEREQNSKMHMHEITDLPFLGTPQISQHMASGSCSRAAPCVRQVHRQQYSYPT